MKYNTDMLEAPVNVRLEAVIELPCPEWTTSIEPREMIDEEALKELLITSVENVLSS